MEKNRKRDEKVVTACLQLLNPSKEQTGDARDMHARMYGWGSTAKLLDSCAAMIRGEWKRNDRRERTELERTLRGSGGQFEFSSDRSSVRRTDWRTFLSSERDQICATVLFGDPCKGRFKKVNPCPLAHNPASFLPREHKDSYCELHYRHILFPWFACPYRHYCHKAHSKEELRPDLQDTLPEPTVASLCQALGLQMVGGRPVLPRPIRNRDSKQHPVPCKRAILLGPGKCRRDPCPCAHHPEEISQSFREEMEAQTVFCERATDKKSQQWPFGCPYGKDHCRLPHTDNPDDPEIKYFRTMAQTIRSGSTANMRNILFTCFDRTHTKLRFSHVAGLLKIAINANKPEAGKVLLERLATGTGVGGEQVDRDNLMLEYALLMKGNMFEQCLRWCELNETREFPCLMSFFDHLVHKGVHKNIIKLEFVHDVAIRSFNRPLLYPGVPRGDWARLFLFRDAIRKEAEETAELRESIAAAGGAEEYVDQVLMNQLHAVVSEAAKEAVERTDHPLNRLPRTPLEILQRIYLEAAHIDSEKAFHRELHWICQKTGAYPELVSPFLHWAYWDKPTVMFEVAAIQSQLDRRPHAPQAIPSFQHLIEDEAGWEDLWESGEGKKKKKDRQQKKEEKKKPEIFGEWRGFNPKKLDPLPFTPQVRACALSLVLTSPSFSQGTVRILVKTLRASPLLPLQPCLGGGRFKRSAIFSAQTYDVVLYLLEWSGKAEEDLQDEEIKDDNGSTLLHVACAWTPEGVKPDRFRTPQGKKELHHGMLLLRKFSVPMIRMMMYEMNAQKHNPRDVAIRKGNKDAQLLLEFFHENPSAGFAQAIAKIQKGVRPAVL
uniref:Uncharacterized protein n=1 Tax=Chromera velia CCMP2878 TaxID=1169474 RepID=A0A0G4HL70_9ALVE|eukprot:Cvel_28672.t1-p1 / transcript=Cvel_28672.t1 / gene=Cvel_28672 / organism=Chromera_velia_CCMP2878 / gene_product=hypothetical protein / transcript_product=hypothetical protein / location=Cvel_scaffold3799:6221-9400(+) / protein_length=831 / sequence_SO=supercontig / SO=protein_coding / is_pseudo=false